MPAGLPYFAWIDASETTFGAEHMRWDEQVFSFTLAQEEGDPANLTAVVRRPRNVAGDPIGLLGPGRKIWAWFALDCGPALIKFRGRLVGIPTSLFEELVTLEFVAKPVDLVAQKEALADTLRILPYYDPTVIDASRRDDPDLVLEGYTKVWHFDRETHVITVSDEITGEDGLVEFDGGTEDGKVLYDGLGLTLTSGPLSRVDVSAEYTWTQQARGTVDLTQYLISAWPNSSNGIILFPGPSWPKPGTGIGDGWEVADATVVDYGDVSTVTETSGLTLIVESDGGGAVRAQYSKSETSYIGTARLYKVVGPEIVTDTTSQTYDEDGNTSSYSRSYSSQATWIALCSCRPTLVAGYTAERHCTERVMFSLFADVQPILTDPEDGEALRLDNIRSVNLSDVEEGMPIGDPRLRSYIATGRGNQSLEHLIALARAHLMKRARTIEIAFAPKLSRMPEITLRKNAFLVEPRVGEALGKIIGYSIALDGSDGRMRCEVRIGCTIGRGGLAVATDGTPTYCSIDYVGPDYQRFIDRTVLVDAFADSSVGYQPPNADPNDDGLNFLGAIRAADVIEQPLSVVYGSDEAVPQQPVWAGSVGEDSRNAASAYANNELKPYEVRATFKLISMKREFSTDYEIQVTDLKIPTGYDLEAV